jgi:P-type conjugative transfer protein TrbJ
VSKHEKEVLRIAWSNSSMKKTIVSIIVMALVVAIPLTSPGTGIPVFDASNLTQNITTALKQVQAYAQQVQQYQLQLQQYKSQLLQATGISQAAQIWGQAQQTLASVTGTVNMFRNGGALQGYLQNAQNVNYWLASSPTQNGSQSAGYWSNTQHAANGQMVKEIAQQEAQLQADAQTLQRLTSQASSVQTQRQALDLANEMSGLQQKSLLEIRTLLVSQQQAVAARNGATSNDEAMHQAATQQYMNVQLGAQPHTGW